ncbi:terpene cyclase/mutase family protein [Candidatus Woesearchaeota archaeon]|nr:terpene cyclase/mutase family protein [Candidatus Woesearchaeota archaeon]
MIQNININLEKTKKFLISSQKENGSWIIPSNKIDHRKPPYFENPLVYTSKCVRSLIIIGGNDCFDNISKGINYCLNYKLRKEDNVALWAEKLALLNYTNSKYYNKEKKEIIYFILKNKTKEGYWPFFPDTSSLINFVAFFSLYPHINFKEFEPLKNWIKNNKAKDGIGWGDISDKNESKTTHTSLYTFILIMLGEDPTSEEMNKIRIFLEKNQNKDGGWSSSSVKPEVSSTYGTSVNLTTLMLLSKDPFNIKISKGIRFLLKLQKENGYWPIRANEEIQSYFQIWYVIRVLTIYKFLKDMLNSNKYKLYNKSVDLRHIVSNLLISRRNNLVKDFSFSYNRNIIQSKILGTTKKSSERRKEILSILNNKSPLSLIEIFDMLKEKKEFSHLNKKYHLTQIKNDIEYLLSSKLIHEYPKNKFLVFNNYLSD